MNRLLTVAVAGCGNRGQHTYSRMLMDMQDKVKIVAAADLDPSKLAGIRQLCGLTEEQCYASAEEMLSRPKLADLMLICTPDSCHYAHAKAALLKDYHLLLEKPISPTAEECRELAALAEERERHVAVCHVLRYTPFYQKIRQLLDEGLCGEVITVQGIEQVGYWHYAHSFVRGNWRREDESSCMLLAKCCHDMDILLWLLGKKCVQVSSLGSLRHFRPENAPAGAAARCTDCTVKDCPFNAVNYYVNRYRRTGDSWPQNVVAFEPTEEKLMHALRHGPYGRCVYHSDNDVVDHQVVLMELEDGTTVDFTMSGFTANNARHLRVMGTRGEIVADMNAMTIEATHFGSPTEVIDVKKLAEDLSGHGGGDRRLVREYIDFLRGDCPMTTTMTSIGRSVESHLVAFAAEVSRKAGGVPVKL
ncbi:MAG: Gfo/Idh/MocA family oxidoreductase [Clostridia bacterium]|nr:Gfo/Idh/MocA family oxidoreductase [Clostridia bacterium]